MIDIIIVRMPADFGDRNHRNLVGNVATSALSTVTKAISQKLT